MIHAEPMRRDPCSGLRARPRRTFVTLSPDVRDLSRSALSIGWLMSGKQRKFRVKASGFEEDDVGQQDVATPDVTTATAPPPPPPKPSAPVNSKPAPALLSFDEDVGDDGPASMAAPRKKDGGKAPDRKPKLGRAQVQMPDTLPAVMPTQRSSTGARMGMGGAHGVHGHGRVRMVCMAMEGCAWCA